MASCSSRKACARSRSSLSAASVWCSALTSRSSPTKRGGSLSAIRPTDRSHREQSAVACRCATHLAADADDPGRAGLEIARQVAVVRTAIRFGHELADVRAEQFVGRVSEDAAGGIVDCQHVAAVIDHHDRIHRRLHECLGFPGKHGPSMELPAGASVRNTPDVIGMGECRGARDSRHWPHETPSTISCREVRDALLVARRRVARAPGARARRPAPRARATAARFSRCRHPAGKRRIAPGPRALGQRELQHIDPRSNASSRHLRRCAQVLRRDRCGGCEPSLRHHCRAARRPDMDKLTSISRLSSVQRRGGADKAVALAGHFGARVGLW